MSRLSLARKAIVYAVAPLYALFVLLLSLVLTGAGHGWGGALVASVPFAIAIPWAAYRWSRQIEHPNGAWWPVWISFLAGDALTAFGLFTELPYFLRVLSGALIWLIL